MPAMGATPLRFAHSSGALALDQATRSEIEKAFAGLDRAPVVMQAMPNLDAGGLEQPGLFAAEATAIAGGQAIVAASGDPIDRLKRIGADFKALPLDGKGPVAVGRNTGRIKRAIDEAGADIVHARNREIAWAARQATRTLIGEARTKLVTSVGGDAAYRDGGALLDGDCIIAGSAYVRDAIAKAEPKKADRLAVIPDGVDLAHFTPSAVSSERLGRLARAWGLLEEPAPTILVPGQITAARGQHTLVRALTYVHAVPDLADTVTIIAGDAGPKNAYAEQLAKIVRRGGGGRVFLSAALDDLPAAMMLSDLVVSLPTEPLGQDPTAAMAMALGKPVLGAKHGATAETVADGETGRLVSPDDPERVAAALRELLLMQALARDDLAAKARARAERYFSSSAAALATVKLYGALLRHGAGSTAR